MKIKISLLITVCLLVYFPILGNQLQTVWDDQWQVLCRYTWGGFSLHNLKAIFTETLQGQYSPVNQLIYTFIYFLDGVHPFGYHLYGLLLHAANACLVYCLLRKVLMQAQNRVPSPVSRVPFEDKVAFLAALLFAVHPMNVEAVSWASASKVLLFTFFTLLSYLAYLRYGDSGKWGVYLLSFVLFVLSCGSKEQAVVLPVCLLLTDMFVGRNMKDKMVWMEKAPFFLFAVLAGLFTLSLQDAPLIAERAGYPLWQRLVLACYSLSEYVIKLVAPLKLLYLYPFPMPPGKDLPPRFYIYPVLMLAAIIGILSVRKRRIICFGILFFLVNIAFTLHIAPMSRYAIIADRYVYLPSVGLFLIGAYYAVAYTVGQTKWKQRLIPAFAVCYVLSLGIYAHQRTKVWYDSDTLKREMRELLQERNDYEKVKN